MNCSLKLVISLLIMNFDLFTMKASKNYDWFQVNWNKHLVLKFEQENVYLKNAKFPFYKITSYQAILLPRSMLVNVAVPDINNRDVETIKTARVRSQLNPRKNDIANRLAVSSKSTTTYIYIKSTKWQKRNFRKHTDHQSSGRCNLTQNKYMWRQNVFVCVPSVIYDCRIFSFEVSHHYNFKRTIDSNPKTIIHW